MLNVVVDTNVFVSGLLAPSLNRDVIIALKNFKFNLIISIELFDELLDVVTRVKFRSILTHEVVYNLIEIIKTQAKFVNPRQKVSICRDIEDQKILECALEGADIIVSSDKDLLILNTFHSIPIITPKDFIDGLKK